VLIADDDQVVCEVLTALLRQAGHEVVAVHSGDAALEALTRTPADALLLDLRMPGMDGMTVLAKARDSWPDLPVVMMTAHGTVASAVEAMKRGAADFIQKPIDRDELLFVLDKAMRRNEPAAPPSQPRLPGGMIGNSAAMLETSELIRKAARGTATVLIRGESGTGKELAAQALHELSPRSKGPFIRVHCGALPDNLLESELFGYERGAFTGAVTRKPGRVELADGGTLFLDEIGDITVAMQVKLLRLLQDRTFERLGGTESLKADVRFVAATHQPLEQRVKEGQFREDLFYRLNVVPVFLPPLRARPGDIPALAHAFVKSTGERNGRTEVSLASDAIAALSAHPWPGNVRQLQNFIERLVVLSDDGVLSAEDVRRELQRADAFSAPAEAPSAAVPATGALLQQRLNAERSALADAMARSKRNRTVAARLLGISRRTLYNKLKDHGLD
jgi:two-component system response regulator AtoC